MPITTTGAGGPTSSGPTNLSLPVISGTNTVGQTFSTTNGTWTGSPTFTYQWYSAGLSIQFATSNTYLLQSSDKLHLITVIVTATTISGSTQATALAVGPIAFLGQVATRSFVPAGGNSGQGNIMSRTAHVATDVITGLQVKFPAYHIQGGVAEAPNSGTTTFTASVEYPAGTFTQIKWSGSASKAVSITFIGCNLLDTGLSDIAVVSIPKGSVFWIRNYGVIGTTGSFGCTLGTQSTRWVAQGEASVFGGGTDLTLSGTVTDGGSGAFIYPLCIVSTTVIPSFAVNGDSRTLGTGFGVPDSNGNQGQFTPSLGAVYGYGNLACGGDELFVMVRGGFQRRSLFQYFSHLPNGYLINDSAAAGGNRTATQMEANLQTLWLMAQPAQPIINCTVYPETTGTFLTPGGQTVNGNYAALATTNTYIRTKPSPVSAVIDLALLLEDQANLGKWITSPSPPYTGDGLHANLTGYNVITSSGAINGATLAAITSPPIFTIVDFPTLAAMWDTSSQGSGVTSAGVPSRISQATLTQTNTTLSTTSFNGGYGMTLSASATSLGDAIGTKPICNGNSGLTYALLCQVNALPGTNRDWFGFTINGSNSERAMVTITTTGLLGLSVRRLDTDAASTAVGTVPITINSNLLILAVFDPANTGTATLYANGVLQCTATFLSTGNFSATNSNNWTLSGVSSLPVVSIYRECDIWVSALSTTDLLVAAGEIAWRQGFQGSVLPVTSPFLLAPPHSDYSPSVNLSLPVISGTLVVGSTLTTTNGTWTGNPSFTYQWYSNGVLLLNATSSTYTLQSGDKLHNISVVVTANTSTTITTATSVAVGPIAFLGQIATRSFTPSNGNLSNSNVMSRTAHIATDVITSLQVKFPGYRLSGGTNEGANSGTTTYTASVEYPAGTFTQIKWSGSASTVIASGLNPIIQLLDTGLSDIATVSIPKGSIFWIRNYCVNGTPGNLGATFGTPTTRWVAQGEAAAYGGNTDLTLSGTVTDGGIGAYIYPLCIVANTTIPSFAVAGDSRTLGNGWVGVPDSNGNMGQFTPSLGSTYGYINSGLPNDTLFVMVRSSTQRRSTFQYCSHLSNGYLTNDANASNGNRTVAQMEDSLQTFWEMGQSAQPIVQCTVYPITTGTWLTPGGQTVNTNYPALASVNSYIRGKPLPIAGVPDLALVLEDQSNLGKWITSPSPPYTADGTHCNGGASGSGGYPFIVSSGAINASTLAALTSPPLLNILDFPSLVGWFDVSSQGAGVTSSAMPSRASQLNMTGTSTLSSTSFAGGWGMSFSGGGSDIMSGAANTLSLPNGLAGFTLVILCEFQSFASAIRNWYGYTTNVGTASRGMISFNSSNQLGLTFQRLDADSPVTTFSTTVPTTNTPGITVAVFDPAGSGTATLRWNGVQIAQGNFATTGVFSATNAAGFLLADFNFNRTALIAREWDLLLTALSVTDCQRIEGQVVWRQLGNSGPLPSNHPYFSGPPQN